jgi:cytochrome c
MYRFRILALSLTLMAASKMAISQPKGDAAKGKAVFEQCAVCHSADTDEKKVGPALKGLYKRDKMVNGKKPTDATVKARIEEGGSGMPPYKDMLSDDEKGDLLAYLRTL